MDLKINDMEELLTKHGFENDLHNDEWRKQNWTIRFSLSEIEAFNTPLLNTPGWYAKVPLTEESLQNVIDDIEQYLS